MLLGVDEANEHRHCVSPILDNVSLNDLATVVIVHMQSVPITTNIVSSNPAHGEVYTIQHYSTLCGNVCQ